jgi:hypothetical protein
MKPLPLDGAGTGSLPLWWDITTHTGGRLSSPQATHMGSNKGALEAATAALLPPWSAIRSHLVYSRSDESVKDETSDITFSLNTVSRLNKFNKNK